MASTGEGCLLEVADGLGDAGAGHVDLVLEAVRRHLLRRPRRHRRVLVVEVPAPGSRVFRVQTQSCCAAVQREGFSKPFLIILFPNCCAGVAGGPSRVIHLFIRWI